MATYLRLERTKSFDILLTNYPSVNEDIEHAYEKAEALYNEKKKARPDQATIQELTDAIAKLRHAGEDALRLELADIVLHNELVVEGFGWLRAIDKTRWFKATIHIVYRDKNLRDHVGIAIEENHPGQEAGNG